MKTQNDSFENRLRCEARVTGKKSHEFATPSAEAARAMCDAHGWEFIRIYAPGSHADVPKSKPTTGDGPLTAKQVKCLVTEARKTFDTLSNMGNIADTFDSWRHGVVYQTVRREGLKMCQSSHYRKLLTTFRAMRGAADPGGAPAKSRRQSREGGDTGERREQLMFLLAHELASHAKRVENPQTPEEVRWAAMASSKGGVITEAYLLAIARAKNAGTTLHDTECLIKLTSARLEELVFTLRNRISAREGRGETAKRNKKQSGKDTPPQA